MFRHVSYTYRIHSLVCTVLLPLSGISDSVVDSVDRLEYLLRILNPFPSWNTLFYLCKLQVRMFSTHNVTLSFSVSITSEFYWTASVQKKIVVPGLCLLLSSMESVVNAVSKLRCILDVLNTRASCVMGFQT